MTNLISFKLEEVLNGLLVQLRKAEAYDTLCHQLGCDSANNRFITNLPELLAEKDKMIKELQKQKEEEFLETFYYPVEIYKDGVSINLTKTHLTAEGAQSSITQPDGKKYAVVKVMKTIVQRFGDSDV